jgi:hypothetical protein
LNTCIYNFKKEEAEKERKGKENGNGRGSEGRRGQREENMGTEDRKGREGPYYKGQPP